MLSTLRIRPTFLLVWVLAHGVPWECVKFTASGWHCCYYSSVSGTLVGRPRYCVAHYEEDAQGVPILDHKHREACTHVSARFGKRSNAASGSCLSKALTV